MGILVFYIFGVMVYKFREVVPAPFGTFQHSWNTCLCRQAGPTLRSDSGGGERPPSHEAPNTRQDVRGVTSSVFL